MRKQEREREKDGKERKKEKEEKEKRKKERRKRKRDGKERTPPPRCSNSIMRLLSDKAVYRISMKLFIAYTFFVTGLGEVTGLVSYYSCLEYKPVVHFYVNSNWEMRSDKYIFSS